MSARAWSAFAAVSTLWGIPYLFIKIAVDDGVPPIFLAWARVTLAAVVLLALSMRAGVLGPVRPKLRWLWAYAVIEIVIPFPLIGAGEQHVASSLAAILIAAVPMLVALLAIRFEPSERATGRRAVGLVIGFAGVIALVGLDVSGSTAELLGALAILLAAVGYAAGPMIMSRHLTELDPRALMAVALSMASLVLMPAALLDPPAVTPAGEAIAAIVVLGLLCTAAAFVLFGVLIAEVGPGRGTVITYVAPVVAVALGVTVLGERPGAGAVAGLLLILAGSWLSTDGRLPPGLVRRVGARRGTLPNPVIPDRHSSQADSRVSARSITIMSPTRLFVGAVLVPAVLLLAACGSDDKSSSSAGAPAAKTTASSPGASSCQKDTLALRTAGQLTIATDKPAYPPYFVDDKPENGKGFESAVAYAIAKELGFTPAEVKWIVVPFNASYAPGKKKFDFDVNQISISPARAKHVDFSKPYYTSQQAVVALKKSSAASATSLAGLKDAKLGVQIGTTSLDATSASIQPSSQPRVYNDSNDVVRALKGGQIDAVVVDVPTAFYLTGAEVPQAKIVGQFSAPGGDTWGALLEKGSKLTPCVSQAVDKLTASGELKQLESKWMGAAAGAPELR
jgi:drug/metabolite transporter (DMT)-like permease/ABC-type amino acid transport substrate-binding protein